MHGLCEKINKKETLEKLPSGVRRPLRIYRTKEDNNQIRDYDSTKGIRTMELGVPKPQDEKWCTGKPHYHSLQPPRSLIGALILCHSMA